MLHTVQDIFEAKSGALCNRDSMLKDIFQNVRLDADLRRKLEQTSELTGLDKSTLIRIAVKALLTEIENNGGRLVLPLPALDSPALTAETKAPYRAMLRKRKPPTDP